MEFIKNLLFLVIIGVVISNSAQAQYESCSSLNEQTGRYVYKTCTINIDWSSDVSVLVSKYELSEKQFTKAYNEGFVDFSTRQTSSSNHTVLNQEVIIKKFSLIFDENAGFRVEEKSTEIKYKLNELFLPIVIFSLFVLYYSVDCFKIVFLSVLSSVLVTSVLLLTLSGIYDGLLLQGVMFLLFIAYGMFFEHIYKIEGSGRVLLSGASISAFMITVLMSENGISTTLMQWYMLLLTILLFGYVVSLLSNKYSPKKQL